MLLAGRRRHRRQPARLNPSLGGSRGRPRIPRWCAALLDSGRARPGGGGPAACSSTPRTGQERTAAPWPPIRGSVPSVHGPHHHRAITLSISSLGIGHVNLRSAMRCTQRRRTGADGEIRPIRFKLGAAAEPYRARRSKILEGADPHPLPPVRASPPATGAPRRSHAPARPRTPAGTVRQGDHRNAQRTPGGGSRQPIGASATCRPGAVWGRPACRPGSRSTAQRSCSVISSSRRPIRPGFGDWSTEQQAESA